MEAKKQEKPSEVLDKCIDMSKVKLDVLKAQINMKISNVFQIEKFVYNELKLEQFISPMKMRRNMTEFLNDLRVKQFISELWPILLAAQESAVSKPNKLMEPKKDGSNQTKHRNGNEQSKSSSHSRSRKQSNMVNSGKEPFVPPKTFNQDAIENDVKHREKHNESTSLSASSESRNSGTGSDTQAEQKPPLVPYNTFGSSLKPQQRINVLNAGKHPLAPSKTLSSKLKPQGRIDISKVKLDTLKQWISKKIFDILEREDNAVVEFVYNKLKQDQMLCKQKFQIRIAGFLNGGKAQKFVCELWPLLLSAQESESGIPAEFMQQEKDEIEKGIKHDESASLSGSTNSQISGVGMSTKVDEKQCLTTNTLSINNQRPDKENNKNSINIENQLSKQDKSLSKDNQIDKNKYSKRSAGCSSQYRDTERSHNSRSSTANKKSASKIASKSREHGSDDGKACGLNGFENNCMFSPKTLQQETKAISLDQRPSTPIGEFLSEHCSQTHEFLNLWNEAPDKETILLSTKFIYPEEKNIEKQVNATLLPAAVSVRKSDHKQPKPNIDKVVKAEVEIKAARELQSRKRTHSTMSNESKRSESDSSNKDEQQKAKKNRTKVKKSSTKHSSDRGSSRKPEAELSKQKAHKKYSKAMRERMLELFGNCSSDEEEHRPDKASSSEKT